MVKIKTKRKNKRFFVLFIMLFIVGSSTFSANFTYDPLNFTIKARYVKPLKIEFVDDSMDLGVFIENQNLNTMSKTFSANIDGEPNDSITISVNPTVTITNVAKGKSLTIKQSLGDRTLSIPASGTKSTTIIFTSDDIVATNGDGIYSGTTTITATVN